MPTDSGFEAKNEDVVAARNKIATVIIPVSFALLQKIITRECCSCSCCSFTIATDTATATAS